MFVPPPRGAVEHPPRRTGRREVDSGAKWTSRSAPNAPEHHPRHTLGVLAGGGEIRPGERESPDAYRHRHTASEGAGRSEDVEHRLLVHASRGQDPEPAAVVVAKTVERIERLHREVR